MAVNGPGMVGLGIHSRMTNQPKEDLTIKVNRFIGIKQYKEMKRAMEDFETKFQLELLKTSNVDQKIR